MDQTDPKRPSFARQGLHLLLIALGLFFIGVYIYGWHNMLILWAPENPKGRSALHGAALGSLVVSICLFLAQLAVPYIKKQLDKNQKPV